MHKEHTQAKIIKTMQALNSEIPQLTVDNDADSSLSE